MRTSLVLRSVAEREIAEAAKWYSAIRNILGIRFLDEVAETLERISIQPKLYRIFIPPEIRRAPVEHFPYHIFFIIDPGEITVVGCQHTSQNPDTWPTE